MTDYNFYTFFNDALQWCCIILIGSMLPFGRKGKGDGN